MTNVTIDSNKASFGGGLSNYLTGTANLTNVTLSGNSATDHGGGMLQYGSLSGQVITLKNSIVANSSSGGNCYQDPSSVSSIKSNGFNLSDDISCDRFLDQNSDLKNDKPLLGPLANNGGPTLTYLSLRGSPAIDNGSGIGCPATDQRGVIRPQGAACDIGAVEYRVGDVTPWLYLPMIER